jgi:hypothetical protein
MQMTFLELRLWIRLFDKTANLLLPKKMWVGNCSSIMRGRNVERATRSLYVRITPDGRTIAEQPGERTKLTRKVSALNRMPATTPEENPRRRQHMNVEIRTPYSTDVILLFE